MKSVPEHTRSIGALPAGAASEKDAGDRVHAMFDTVAPTYDRANHLLSFGLDRLWWRRAARCFTGVLRRPEARVLDLCCGTGDMTAALLKLRPSGSSEPVLAVDISAPMLDRARHKLSSANVRFLRADAMALPLETASLDLVVAAFGFRNLPNYAAALCEIARVLKPGASLGILEANQPSGASGALYSLYFHHLLPRLGGLLTGQRAAYRYLPASVARFPRPPRMLQLMRDNGFPDADWDSYTWGAAGLFRGTRASGRSYPEAV